MVDISALSAETRHPRRRRENPAFFIKAGLRLSQGQTALKHLVCKVVFSFIKSSPLVLSSLSKSSGMFRCIVESIYISVLPRVCRRRKQSYNPSHTQGCSGQEAQTMEKTESNSQGQYCRLSQDMKEASLTWWLDPGQPLRRRPPNISKVFVRIFQIIPCYLLSP